MSGFGEKSSILFCLKCLLDIKLETPIGFAGLRFMGEVRSQALGLGLIYLDSSLGGFWYKKARILESCRPEFSVLSHALEIIISLNRCLLVCKMDIEMHTSGVCVALN